MKKTVIVIIAVISCLVCLAAVLCLTSNNNNDVNDTLPKNVVRITNFSIDGREILKVDNEIYVGNNLKELQNNFYDIKIQNANDGANVYLNKLWYENYGDDYIQDEYLAEICRQLSGNLNIQSGAEQFEYVLYKYIKDNYVKVRQNETIEQIVTDKLTLNLKLEDYVVKLEIRGR